MRKYTVWKRWSTAPDHLAQPANQVVYESKLAAAEAMENMAKTSPGRIFFLVPVK